MVFHNQDDDISAELQFLNKRLSDINCDVPFIHTSPLIRQDEPFEDWLYCNIEIDENYVNNYFGSNNSTIKKVLLLHEMGHVFGLAHTTSTATIMYPYLDAITVTKVTYADSAALVEKLDF